MEQWDEVYKKEGRHFLKPERYMARIAKIFKKNKVKKILDLGCGTGRHTVFLAKKGFEVHGIDIAGEGIRLAREWLKEEGLEAYLKVGNIYEKLPYKDNFFDAVISIKVMHHAGAGKIRELIKEIGRVLKPKGMLFVVVPKKGRGEKHKFRTIAKNTYIPTEGPEKGLIHYLFTKGALGKEFKNFKILELKTAERHYELLGEKKIL